MDIALTKVKKFKLTPKLKRKLDRLFSQYILKKYNRTCCRCGSVGIKVDTAHIIPRTVTHMRWMENNALCLCVKCHKWGKDAFHQNPLSFTMWFDSTYGRERIDQLLQMSIKVSVMSNVEVLSLIDKLKDPTNQC